MNTSIIKRIFLVILIMFIIFGTISIYATNNTNNTNNANNANNNSDSSILDSEVAGELTQMRDKAKNEIADYVELYGSDAYGMTAYILNKIRLYSIPFCFVGIAVGAIFQYVIGIRKLDFRDRGLSLVITFITILVICQILPLIFAIVVRGWRD